MRTVAGPAGRPGIASGVEPTSRSFTNTRAPVGLDRTLTPPGLPAVLSTVAPRAEADAPLAPPGTAAISRRLNVVDAVGRRAVNCSVRSWMTYPSRATRMLYDPSSKSRTVSGVFPRARPFTITSASAGDDRINTLPRAGFCAPAIAPDAGRDGVGAGRRGVVSGAGTGAGASVGALAGRSTVVSSTMVFGSRVATGVGDLRKNPTDNAASTAKPTNTATIGHRRLREGRTSSAVCSARGGWADQAAGNGVDVG